VLTGLSHFDDFIRVQGGVLVHHLVWKEPNVVVFVREARASMIAKVTLGGEQRWIGGASLGRTASTAASPFWNELSFLIKVDIIWSILRKWGQQLMLSIDLHIF
jgi:hypothetical protein